ncbi:hypothetical protein GCM10007298_07030 [Williamsia phyllosphaerae]|uniref:Uncharacterized protein n=1 Tax=Williamsia phyllosphaerae TaxID=885042 RepID=A0ABQ1UAY9_9NOCA|nr:hypothetical protein GCM10007298_07030 [Williamsia phyllosphaerae]
MNRGDVIGEVDRDRREGVDSGTVGGQQVREDQRVGPAVGERVVHGLHQSVLGVGQAQQRETDRWRGVEVERSGQRASRPLVRAHGGIGVRSQVHLLDVGRLMGFDDLDESTGRRGREPCSQSGMAGHDGVDRRGEPVDIDPAGDRGDLLHHIGIGDIGACCPVTGQQYRVEVHPALQRQQRQDVVRWSVGRRQCGDVLRRQIHLTEVRRRVAADPRSGESGQGRHPAVGQVGHGDVVEDAGGPGDLGDEPGGVARAVDPGVDLECRCGVARIDPLVQLADPGDRGPVGHVGGPV